MDLIFDKIIGGILMDDMLVEYFSGIEFGKLQQFGVMGVLPVFAKKSWKY